MKTISTIIYIPFDLNEIIHDKIARERKKGNRTSKEKIIIELLNKNRKELMQ